MRATLKQVARHPSWLYEWWLDCPWRKPRNIKALLFTKGRGWLRWGQDQYDVADDYFEGYACSWATFTCAPPLRRGWDRAWYMLITRPLLAWPGYRHPEDSERHRLSWSETRLTRDDRFYARDPEWPAGYTL